MLTYIYMGTGRIITQFGRHITLALPHLHDSEVWVMRILFETLGKYIILIRRV